MDVKAWKDDRQRLAAQIKQLMRDEERRQGDNFDMNVLASRIGVKSKAVYAYLNGSLLPPAARLERLLCEFGADEKRRAQLGRWRDQLDDQRKILRQSADHLSAPTSDGEIPAGAENGHTRGPSHGAASASRFGRRTRVVFLAAVVVVCIGAVYAAMAGSGAVPDNRGSAPPVSGQAPALDGSRAMEKMRNTPLCAESLTIDPVLTQNSQPRAAKPGPIDDPTPTRQIELHFVKTPKLGWVAFARLATSTSDLDRLWFDWSYLPEPVSGRTEQWRQCTPQPITRGWDTVAALVADHDGNPRWFRACGQAPPEDRPPDSTTRSFCTIWLRPQE